MVVGFHWHKGYFLTKIRGALGFQWCYACLELGNVQHWVNGVNLKD